MAARAAPRIRSDSIAVNQNEMWCPDSCQMISGRVLPTTAVHATMRGHGSDDAGVTGFICLADIVAAFMTRVPARRSIFRGREFRPPVRARNPSRREYDRGMFCCL